MPKSACVSRKCKQCTLCVVLVMDPPFRQVPLPVQYAVVMQSQVRLCNVLTSVLYRHLPSWIGVGSNANPRITMLSCR